MVNTVYIAIESTQLVIGALISIAILTLIERKSMGQMQRREGPETVGWNGVLQPIVDGVKLGIKEFIIPQSSYTWIFQVSGLISMGITLLMWLILPFYKGSEIIEVGYSLLLLLALSNIGIYGILLSGWAGNSKYSVLGSMRSSSQMISYELALTLQILCIIVGQDYHISKLQEIQGFEYNLFELWPIGILYFISIIGELNRAPFDLPEAESELVSGFNTEHSGLPFALFFLGEYGAMIVQSIVLSNLLLGGTEIFYISLGPWLGIMLLNLKVVLILLTLIWIRATLPRFRYDLLQSLAWNAILPITLAYIIFFI